MVLAAAAVGVLAVAVAPGGVAADPQAQAAGVPFKRTVSVGDNFFAPAKTNVARLGKVKWTNKGQVEHNVTFKDGYSRNFGPGESIVKKFNRRCGRGHRGPCSYCCTLHPPMSGTIKVKPVG